MSTKFEDVRADLEADMLHSDVEAEEVDEKTALVQGDGADKPKKSKKYTDMQKLVILGVVLLIPAVVALSTVGIVFLAIGKCSCSSNGDEPTTQQQIDSLRNAGEKKLPINVVWLGGSLVADMNEQEFWASASKNFDLGVWRNYFTLQWRQFTYDSRNYFTGYRVSQSGAGPSELVTLVKNHALSEDKFNTSGSRINVVMVYSGRLDWSVEKNVEETTKLVTEIRERLPYTQIVVLGLMEVQSKDKNAPYGGRQYVMDINAAYKKAFQNWPKKDDCEIVSFMDDQSSLFVNKDDKVDPKYFSENAITTEGYQVLTESLQQRQLKPLLEDVNGKCKFETRVGTLVPVQSQVTPVRQQSQVTPADQDEILESSAAMRAAMFYPDDFQEDFH